MNNSNKSVAFATLVYNVLFVISSCCLLVPRFLHANDSLLTEDEFLTNIPLVLTASRLVQPLNEVPVAVTVIDRTMIEASGFTEIADLFRLVPGFIAGYYRGNAPVVGNLFQNDSFSRRMQVIVDGRSVYAPSIGGPIWSTLPLNIDDIERIEVVRGPNAASHGSNSFTGVINIITRDTVLESGGYFRTNLGERGLKEGTLRYGKGGDKLNYRLSLWYQEHDGFRNQFDGKEVRNLSGRVDYHLSEHDILRMQLGFSEADIQRNEPGDPLTPEHYNDDSANFQMLKWEHTLKSGSEFYVKFYRNYDRHTEELVLQDVPLVGSLPVDQNYKSERLDLEFQITQKLTPSLNVAWGGSTRRDQVDSPRFLGSFNPVNINVHRAFINAAWDVSDKFFINGGLMLEKTNITDDSYSPLLSLHYRINDNNTVRVAATRASRIPVAVEEFPDTSVTIPGFGITDQLFFKDKDLDAETNSSYNIGLVGQYPKHGIEYDISYARHKLKNIITLRGSAYPDTFDGFANSFDDRDSVTIKTAQASVRYTAPGGSRLIASYAHTTVDATDLNDPTEAISDAAPENTFSLLGIYKINSHYTASAGYYFLDESRYIDGKQQRPDIHRLDVRLAQKIKARQLNGEIALVGQNITGDEDGLYRQNEVDSRWYLSLKIHTN